MELPRWLAGIPPRLRRLLTHEYRLPSPGRLVKTAFFFLLGALAFFMLAACIVFLVGRGIGLEDDDPWAFAWFLAVMILNPAWAVGCSCAAQSNRL